MLLYNCFKGNALSILERWRLANHVTLMMCHLNKRENNGDLVFFLIFYLVYYMQIDVN